MSWNLLNSLKKFLIAVILISGPARIQAQWLEITDIVKKPIQTEHGGRLIEIHYELKDSSVNETHPAYVFIRYSIDSGHSWRLLDHAYLKGDGYDIVPSHGRKSILIWGSDALGLNHPDFRIRGIQMARIPAGKFMMRSFPAGGKDPSKTERPDTFIPEYFMAIHETTLSMYVEFLNEMGRNGGGWHERMANERRGGILRKGEEGQYRYEIMPGREDFPVTYVSWYDAYAFLQWCGLKLPTESMFEKAFVGGIYLDGDESGKIPNLIPDRKYPWGHEVPYQGGIYRCNYDGDEDGYSNLAPVGSFPDFPSPYGIHDLAGNVTEWTLDWYTTTYHIGLDGFRIVRGGSWLAMPLACDAVSGATQFPIKQSSIMGFRGVRVR